MGSAGRHHRPQRDPAGDLEEAQQAVAEWNARCVTRKVDPPVKVDGWVPAGELRVWLRAEDGWWGLVSTRDGLRWFRAENLASPRLDYVVSLWLHLQPCVF